MYRSVFIFLSILVVLTPNEAYRPTKVGNFRPIDNLNDPLVVEAAKFAVVEHNKEANTSLIFVNVVKAEGQVVQGSKYRLDIFTDDGKIYRATVWSMPWVNFLKLYSFDEIGYRVGYKTVAPTPAPTPARSP